MRLSLRFQSGWLATRQIGAGQRLTRPRSRGLGGDVPDYPPGSGDADATEGVPGWGYRHLWTEAEDEAGNKLAVVTYMADGKAEDGNPSLRYITLLREGARAHGLPERHLQILDAVKHAE